MQPPASSISSPSDVALLSGALGVQWPTIAASRAEAARQAATIATLVGDERLIPTDCAFVGFGSLARREWTSGSDVDWTLLVDGAADPQHLTVVQTVNRRLEEERFKPPGATGIFGNLTFSHDLIHRIGGEHDTNRTITQRILLLLEATDVGLGSEVVARVTRALVQRYVDDDRGYQALASRRRRVPRFLLNDVVRYWRTVAVDFAAKRRERAGKGWAVRNFKLRCSRKLLFAAGLAMCLACELNPTTALTSATDGTEDDLFRAMTTFLLDLVARTPLDVLAWFTARWSADDAGAQIFGAYERFLAVLADPGQRAALEGMDLDEALHSNLFRETRRIGDDFQAGLTRLFFATHPDLTEATLRYGVF